MIHSVEGVRDQIGTLALGAPGSALGQSSDSGQADRTRLVTGVTVVS
jgi:hypothetical protein